MPQRSWIACVRPPTPRAGPRMRRTSSACAVDIIIVQSTFKSVQVRAFAPASVTHPTRPGQLRARLGQLGGVGLGRIRRGHRAGVAPSWLRAAYPDPLPGVDPPCSTTRSSGAGRLERLKAMKRTLSIAMGALAIWALMVVTFTQPSANAGPTCTPVGPGLPSQVCTCDIGSHWDAFPGVCEPDADNGSLEPPLLK
jgi:hypothetical protein